jgi:hypothetical protein
MADKLVLRFSTSEDTWQNWMSAAIRRLGHSQFSHVDFVLPDDHEFAGGLLGASDMGAHSPFITGSPRGVAVRPVAYQRFGIRRDLVLQTDKADAVIAAAMSQLGKPFDSSGLWEFIGDKPPEERNWRDVAHWWCSELKAWAKEEGQFFRRRLFAAKSRVSPPDLMLLLDQDERWINRDTFWQPIPGLVLDPGEK